MSYTENNIWIIRLVLPVLFFLFLSVPVSAQFQGVVYETDTNAKIFVGGQEKKMAWSGGFNAPQFAMGDLNNDGRADLVVYEKGPLRVRTFINYGTAGAPEYRYRPHYEKNFPFVYEYLKLEDYNCDGIPDLIHRGSVGYALWKGYYNQDNELSFTFYKNLYYSSLLRGGESFEGAAFPSSGWTVSGAGWSRQTSGTNPSVMPYAGTAMASYNSFGLPAGSSALLISRRLRISPNLGEARISMRVYRNGGAPGVGDSISVYVNKQASAVNATYLGRVARSRLIAQPDTKTSDGWYEYTFPVPLGYSGDTIYFIIKATSQSGNNMYIDDVTWISSNLSGDINVYVEPNDIPAVADIDGDGDLDFLAHSIAGMYVGYYKNYQVEYGLPCDSVVVNLKEGCWGKTFQGYERTHTLGIQNCSLQPNPAPQKTTKTTHTGNTLCFLDMDGDGDYDYLNGNVSFSDIQYLENGKNDHHYPIDTIISQDTTWQNTGAVLQMDLWPAAFWVDIDDDGDKDILIAPHTEGASENINCVAWYENTGTVTNPNYVYKGKDLFSAQTIDLGTNSHPFLYDYNKDGKPDLFVGSEGVFSGGTNLRAKLMYFENTSTVGSISFELRDDNFLNLSSMNVAGAVPAVGDLDNDGLDDLLIGHTDGTISFYKNIAASSTVQPVWKLYQLAIRDKYNVPIDSAEYAAPFIYDIDKDGKKDLIIGNRYGNLYFYKNTGATPGVVELVYQTSNLGMARVDSYNPFSAYAVPFIGRVDNTGNDYLVLGSNSGRIFRYTGFQNGNVTVPYTMLDSAYTHFRMDAGYKYYGLRSAVSIDDIDGDGMYDMVMGNVLGGLHIFNQAQIVSVNENEGTAAGRNAPLCEAYPNPATETVYVQWSASFASEGTVTVSLYSITGQEQLSMQAAASQYGVSIPVSQLAQGTYLCVVNGKKGRENLRVTILR